jgi:hypothetical protein
MDPAHPQYEALTNRIKELEEKINFLQNGETPLQPQEHPVEPNLSTPPLIQPEVGDQPSEHDIPPSYIDVAQQKIIALQTERSAIVNP